MIYPLLAILMLLACGPQLPPEPLLTNRQVINDRKPISKPVTSKEEKWEEFFRSNVTYRMALFLDPRTYAQQVVRQIRRDGVREASNINLYDDVPDSTWFTHRNTFSPLPAEDVGKGNIQQRMSQTGPLKILSKKQTGITPGVIVEDQKNEKFVLKFDHPNFCGMSSGADVIGSRLVYAAGYNVPENHVESLDPNRLVLHDEATSLNKFGEKVKFEKEELEKLKKGLMQGCTYKGKARVMASRFLPGEILGPFPYFRMRRGDSNDKIPHQNRRELRGYTVLTSWINQGDMQEYNTKDTFIKTAGDKGHVLHYFLDYGSAFESSGFSADLDHKRLGYVMDLKVMTKKTVSFGQWPDTEPIPVKFASIGNFSHTDFNPATWLPNNPNPLIVNRSRRDALWGAKLVASFSDQQIEEAVAAGALPEKGAHTEMTQILQKRRNMIARHWFSTVGPMDQFSVVTNGEGLSITFKDWQNSGPWADSTEKITYEWDWKAAVGSRSGKTEKAEINVLSATQWAEFVNVLQTKKGKKRYAKLTVRPKGSRWWTAPATEAFFYVDSDNNLRWVGLHPL